MQVLGVTVPDLRAIVKEAVKATKARDAAEVARKNELALRKEAQESERLQRQLAYIADMSLAQRLLDENKLSLVDKLLKRYAPEQGDRDFRGYYWHHLNDLSKGEEIHTIPHEFMVRSISLSEGGTLLASSTWWRAH